jgi:hypothetical protein
MKFTTVVHDLKTFIKQIGDQSFEFESLENERRTNQSEAGSDRDSFAFHSV